MSVRRMGPGPRNPRTTASSGEAHSFHATSAPVLPGAASGEGARIQHTTPSETGNRATARRSRRCAATVRHAANSGRGLTWAMPVFGAVVHGCSMAIEAPGSSEPSGREIEAQNAAALRAAASGPAAMPKRSHGMSGSMRVASGAGSGACDSCQAPTNPSVPAVPDTTSATASTAPPRSIPGTGRGASARIGTRTTGPATSVASEARMASASRQTRLLHAAPSLSFHEPTCQRCTRCP